MKRTLINECNLLPRFISYKYYNNTIDLNKSEKKTLHFKWFFSLLFKLIVIQYTSVGYNLK